MLIQVNKIEFDFSYYDGEILHEDEQKEVLNHVLIGPWWVENEEDLVDTISDEVNWCVKSIDYDVLS